MAVRHYAGGCQCGAVRFEVDVDIDQAIACNCSRCGKTGTILSFAPADRFSLTAGADSLTEYLFNRHVIRHAFCKVCGVQPFARGAMPDGTPMAAINIRCLDGIDVHELNPAKFEGRSR
ncbi:MAG: aldehyde-activating protein [Alphaproteobacteria bacterium]|nr:MAG: aldehyde-activating protein [Alphaproteobacteria bacterium]